MTNVQKVIKYIAIAFAMFIIFSIITVAMKVTLSLGSIFDDDDSISDKLKDININGDVSILDIDVDNTNIIIKEGLELKAETDSNDLNIRQKNNKLIIDQKNVNWFKNNHVNNLVIYVPENLVLDGVSINSGAGKVTIERLEAKEMYLELGAGNVEINQLTVIKEADINGGAGNLTITNGNFHDLDLDLGVGKVTITSILTGESEIDSGIGEVNLNLIGTINDYKVKLDNGIGSSTFEGQKMHNDTYYGNGNNLIDVEGGIGSINIKLVEIR